MSDNTNIQFANDMLTECIGCIFLAAVILVIFIPLISSKFYKGHVRCVKIVNKRTTSRDMLNFSYTRFNKSNYATFEHNTVDLVYDGKTHIHTLNCTAATFAKLRKGAVYDVVIRYNTIVKIKKIY